ncbi:MAG TPA: sigma-70 family RNA polymerase sigma factor [Vicinamibacterales bacterium]|jgi:RNA polymerase sigma-70 factor (ECF subfamily)|nr:sigma-70 family RNA polymerase sigma factor [Vicinamibacterales bacterium]
MAPEPDAEVLARFVQGEREAFERLFLAFEREVFRWVVRIVREPGAAEDVLVETFWRAYRARARFDPSRSFGAWLRRIATNAALARLRSMRRHPSWSVLDERTAACASDRDLQEAIAIAFGSLPPDLLAVARLALIEQLPQAEIADALDVPIGTVKSRLFRAQRALRDALRRQGIQP